MSLQLLVILVPVIFGLMGFALDLGRLWMVRGELNQAASAMAIAAASKITGGAALDNMYAAATEALNAANGNKYNFGATALTFDPSMLTCFSSTTGAVANDQAATADCASTGAIAVQAQVSAPAPLLFWSLLPGGESRSTTIASYAVAGMSAPLCTACGIEPFAIAALDAADTVNFGLGDPAAGTIYTFAFNCTGNTVPATLTGATGGLMRYVVVNRFAAAGALVDGHQVFRAAARGLAPPTDPATTNPTGSLVPITCVGVNDGAESIWPTAVPVACNAAPPIAVTNALCGLDTRFEDPTTLSACSAFADIGPLFKADTDVATGTDTIAGYAGNGRRLITVAVVDTLATAATGTMTVLGFRQFLLQPNTDGTFLNPGDPNGRFNAMYIGYPKPVQGWFDDRYGLACPIGAMSGPGKVVLHQ
jgi:Flp pilus assembly protein TadG